MADKLKFLVAFVVIVAGIAGFYHYADQSMALRVPALLATLVMAAGIMLWTAPGQQAWAFFGEARTEARKVVWPTRKETVQTTLVVIAMVVVVAAILWVFDLFLTWAVKLLTGQGG
ncbi:MAG: preprotein translocase subunit SecE [Gammaproteobacteria bacterium]|nr:preprotein translocase subunit SecE [Gammaproteobacteria bacterium]